MADSKVLIGRPNSSSPEPNCAICLGSCTNKCFSDSCMHQFCFKCLLEWSKIKAECPLCKQAFKSILHNVKSNEEYEEYVVQTRNDDIHIIENESRREFEEFLFLPGATTSPVRHEFHFRTTFTVDRRGEHAIQQMLLSHPSINGGIITYNSGYHPGRSNSGSVPRRERVDYGATSFRRSIYARNLWVSSLPDITGRFRDVSPSYFRNNPAARQRLVPWINRELNALLFENTPLIMTLTNIIMENLLRYHICSRTFRNILNDYINEKTDHFVHEFYNFMRSPFDMIGYDRYVGYLERPQSPAPYIDVSEENDSDVVIVSTSQAAEPVIDLANSDSDESIIWSSGQAEVPMPIQAEKTEPTREPSAAPPVTLPPKLRHKLKYLQNTGRYLHEKQKRRRGRKRPRPTRSRSSSSSSTDSSDANDSRKESYIRYKARKLLKKFKRDINSSSESDTEVNVTSDSDNDDRPLIDILKKKWRHKDRRKRHAAAVKTETTDVVQHPKNRTSNELQYLPGCSRDVSEPSTSRTVPPQMSTSSSCSSSTSSNVVCPPSCSGYPSGSRRNNVVYETDEEDEMVHSNRPIAHVNKDSSILMSNRSSTMNALSNSIGLIKRLFDSDTSDN